MKAWVKKEHRNLCLFAETPDGRGQTCEMKGKLQSRCQGRGRKVRGIYVNEAVGMLWTEFEEQRVTPMALNETLYAGT